MSIKNFVFYGTFKSFGKNSKFQYDDYFIQGADRIQIGNNFSAGRLFRIQAIGNRSCIKIGSNVSFEDFCHIGCINNIEIGDGTLVASRVFITDHFHGNISYSECDLRPSIRPIKSAQVFIGKNVWIGENVSIMPGVNLGNGVIVGANSVVTHSFPDNVVIAGCPAKIIKNLNPINDILHQKQ